MARITEEQARMRLINIDVEQTDSKDKNTNVRKAPKKQDVVFIRSIGREGSVFLFRKNGEYVLSPNDDELEPVIGILDEEPIDDEETPIPFDDWCEDYADEIIAFQESMTDETGDDALNVQKVNFVDLGLSVNWADKNIGASSPEKDGDYYAWGEIETKKTYTSKTYKYLVDSKTAKNLGESIAKSTNYDKAFILDNASCMPTEEQFKELIEKCTWTKTKLNDVTVWQVVGPNGNKIYFPLNGCISESSTVSYKNYVYCWTANNYPSNSLQARVFRATTAPGFYTMYRRTGAGIRPVSVKQNTSTKKKTIKQLMPFKWNQGSPCNDKLPIDPVTNKKVITGCGNTATGQILAYWGCIGVDGHKYQRGCYGTEAYTSVKTVSNAKRTINIPALSPILKFDYDNLLTTTKLISASKEAKNAVSTMLQYIAYSCKSQFSSSSTTSSTQTTANVLKNVLNMGSKIKLIYSNSGAKTWEDTVYANLEKKWPVLLSGWNSSGSGGHSFVCDGYDAAKDMYHINWGWGGSYDGWFAMSALNAGSYDFNYKKQAVVNICPDYMYGDTNDDYNIDITDVMNIVQAILDNKAYQSKYDINYDGKITQTDVALLVDYVLGKTKM